MVTIQRPDSDPATWTSKNNAPKTVRVMQLANMDIDPEEIFVYDKNAETTKNIKLLVPPHIKIGDKIIINSENLEYVEKAKLYCYRSRTDLGFVYY